MHQSGKQSEKKLQYRNEDIVCLYAGKFGGIYLKEEIFDFLKAASDFWADRFKILLLTSHSQNEVKELCNLADIPFNIFTVLFVRHEEVPQYMRAADFAICPVKPVPTKRYCTPVKNGEYWAMGLPVIITRDISDDSHIIENENAGAVLYNLTADAYRKANKIIDELLVKGKYELTLRIRELATQHRNYKIAEKIYGTIYGKI
ncbi:MAG: glycosyltransferase [Chitinophagaceae bacterium]|nr:glycosyltransferase [Chitinophagaceae bacterium]